MKAWIKRNYYRLYYLKKNVTIGEKVLLNINICLDGLNSLGKNCEIATSKIGLGTYISDNSIIKHTLIGKFCSIGANVQTGIGRHPSKTFVSTHPAFFSSKKQVGFSFAGKNTFMEHIYTDNQNKWMVEIGNDVWVGNNVMIFDGLKIGDGAIIAAGSIVTKDVLPYTIVGGIPAKFMRTRFTEQQIEKIMKIKWWNWELKKIQAHIDLFNDVDSFISFFKN